MNMGAQEQQILHNFLIGFSQDVDHTMLNILFNIVIPDVKERDTILVKSYHRYIQATQSFLDILSKEKIGFGLSCREALQKFVLTQLSDNDIIEEFKKSCGITEDIVN